MATLTARVLTAVGLLLRSKVRNRTRSHIIHSRSLQSSTSRVPRVGAITEDWVTLHRYTYRRSWISLPSRECVLALSYKVFTTETEAAQVKGRYR